MAEFTKEQIQAELQRRKSSPTKEQIMAEINRRKFSVQRKSPLRTFYEEGPGAIASSINDITSLPGQISSLFGGPEFGGIKSLLPENLQETVFPEQETLEGKGLRFLGTGATIAKSTLTPAIQATKNAIRGGKLKEIKLARRVREHINQVEKGSSKAYGAEQKLIELQNPNKSVDLEDVLSNFSQQAKKEKKLKTLINRSETLSDYIKNPTKAKNLTLSESQDLLNSVKEGLPRDIGFEEIPIKRLADSIANKQVEAFPEVAKLKEKYGTIQEQFKTVKGMLSKKTLLPRLRQGLSSPEVEEDFINIISSPKLANEVERYRKLNAIKKALSMPLRVAGVGAIGAGGAYGAHQLLK